MHRIPSIALHALSLLAAAPAALQEGAPVRHLIAVEADAAAGARLLAGDFDVVSARPAREGAATRRFDVIGTDAELERLRALGLSAAVVQEDLARFYAERLAQGAPEGAPALGAWLTPPFGSGSMGGYYTWAEVGSVLDQIAAAYPAIVTPRASIGASLEGRGLWMVKVSDAPGADEAEPEVRIDALHHAREPESMQATLWALLWLVESYGSDPRATWIVDHREIWFLPVVNPDGYVHNQSTDPGGGGLWRKNRRPNGGGSFGVDLNRNYAWQWGFDDEGSSPTPSSEVYRGPAPASEPEVQAMSAFIGARSFRTALSVHTFSDLWLSAWGHTAAAPPHAAAYDEIGALATEENGYPHGSAAAILYLANGVTTDFDQGTRDTLSWTPEIGSDGDGFWPPQSRIVPLAEENLEGVLRTVLAAGAYARVQQVATLDLGDGDGFFEPGEDVGLVVTARNSGRDATAGAVGLTLASPSPVASVTHATTSVGALASFTGATNAGDPLVLHLDAGALPGTAVDWSVTIAWDGYEEATTGRLVVGVPVDLVRDDVEAVLGWQAGLPGDTASTGLWELGDPVGTLSGSEPSNPEDDATPAGTLCFATGNGSSTAGGDDVDGGSTTLVSPRLDLSGVSSARVSYARWFADFTTPDDSLDVSISDDDGASWVPLESIARTANAWTRSSFLVEDFVSLTDRVRLRFVASDDPNNSICEAAVDDLLVETFDADPRFNVYGAAAPGAQVLLNTAGPAGGAYGVFMSFGTGSFSFATIQGPLLLDPLTMTLLLQGTLPAGGLAIDAGTVPSDPGLSGQTVYLQALVVGPGGVFLTNRAAVTFE